MADEGGYLLDNAQTGAARRVAALASLFDGWTRRHLLDLGLAPGWRVWEVGAGGPAMPAWLAGQVGPGGRVLATDIDPRLVAGDGHRNGGTGGDGSAVEIRRHDVGVDPPPGGPFDLVHARLVLVHVPGRDRALAAMVSTLAPGGLLVLEEADPALQPRVCLDEHGPAQQRANRLKDGFRELMARRGVDLAYGRTLPRRMRAAGLVDVAADAYFPLTGPACRELERASVEQIRDGLVAAGLATQDEIDRHLASVDAGELDLATSPLVTAWGRRPA